MLMAWTTVLSMSETRSQEGQILEEMWMNLGILLSLLQLFLIINVKQDLGNVQECSSY